MDKKTLLCLVVDNEIGPKIKNSIEYDIKTYIRACGNRDGYGNADIRYANNARMALKKLDHLNPDIVLFDPHLTPPPRPEYNKHGLYPDGIDKFLHPAISSKYKGIIIAYCTESDRRWDLYDCVKKGADFMISSYPIENHHDTGELFKVLDIVLGVNTVKRK